MARAPAATYTKAGYIQVGHKTYPVFMEEKAPSMGPEPQAYLVAPLKKASQWYRRPERRGHNKGLKSVPLEAFQIGSKVRTQGSIPEVSGIHIVHRYFIAMLLRKVCLSGLFALLAPSRGILWSRLRACCHLCAKLESSSTAFARHGANDKCPHFFSCPWHLGRRGHPFSSSSPSV